MTWSALISRRLTLGAVGDMAEWSGVEWRQMPG